MSQKELFSNQVIEEILRERTNYYLSKQKNKDFWLLISPKFIQNKDFSTKIKLTNFYEQQLKIIKPFNDENEFYVSLITTNLDFIKWIKLRLGYFEDLDSNEILRKDLKSDGVCGLLNNNEQNILKHSPNYLHPDILISQYKNNLELYYQNLN
jgi:hypothetical protein